MQQLRVFNSLYCSAAAVRVVSHTVIKFFFFFFLCVSYSIRHRLLLQ